MGSIHQTEFRLFSEDPLRGDISTVGENGVDQPTEDADMEKVIGKEAFSSH